MPDKDFFQQLREHTGASHKALEDCYPFNTMMQPDKFNNTTYTGVLRVMQGFHHYLNQVAIHQRIPWISPILCADKVETRLAEDLDQLSTQGETITPAPFVLPFPLADGPDQRAKSIACAYVWIGSSMGAKIILRWLMQHYAELPTAYYEAMKEVGNGWADFKRLVCQDGVVSENPELVGNYANQIFLSLIHSAGKVAPSALTPARIS